MMQPASQDDFIDRFVWISRNDVMYVVGTVNGGIGAIIYDPEYPTVPARMVEWTPVQDDNTYPS